MADVGYSKLLTWFHSLKQVDDFITLGLRMHFRFEHNWRVSLTRLTSGILIVQDGILTQSKTNFSMPKKEMHP